jgi:hypothetical protein
MQLIVVQIEFFQPDSLLWEIRTMQLAELCRGALRGHAVGRGENISDEHVNRGWRVALGLAIDRQKGKTLTSRP